MITKREVGPLAVSILIIALVLNINMSINRYRVKKNVQSTANYIEIDGMQRFGLSDDLQSRIDLITEMADLSIPSNDIIEEVLDPIVYDGLTLTELSEKLDRSLNSTISGKGYLIASYSLEKGVDPYMAEAIILEETGCKWNCSYNVNACNNVGGQKGVGCGAYAYFNTLDEGIMAFIDNLANNFIAYGLTTPETINPKYAENPNWSVAVNRYIEQIKAQ